ncbi:MAG: A24 family peptidase [Actinomycetota bacterium]|nr:A24 family peptidase [Actinomycetota bacterium]
MIVAGGVLCGLLGLGVGVFVNRLIDRWCSKGAPARYVIVAALTAGLFAATVFRFGADVVIPAYLVFFTCLVAVSTIDLDRRIIPNRIIYPTIFTSIPLLAIAAAVNGDFESLKNALIGGAAAFAALFVIHLISPAGMGFGDVRLSFILGLFLGWLSLSHVLVGIFLGFLLGAFIGLALVLSRIRSRKDAIPFGPFLAGGAALAVFAGSPIISWWLRT